MMIKKVDFKSRNNKPIMTAYLGADFDQRQAFKEMDQNKVSIKRRRKVYQKLMQFSGWICHLGCVDRKTSLNLGQERTKLQKIKR